MRLLLVLCSAMVLATAAHAQVYKCPDAQGRTIIQQLPCEGGQQLDIRPASGTAPSAPQDSLPTRAEQLNAATEASQQERRLRQLERRSVPRARANIDQHRRQCDRTLASLERDQQAYEQNLYGKLHAVQRATEMAAESTRCDTENRELVDEYKRLLAECQDLGGCANMRP